MPEPTLALCLDMNMDMHTRAWERSVASHLDGFLALHQPSDQKTRNDESHSSPLASHRREANASQEMIGRLELRKLVRGPVFRIPKTAGKRVDLLGRRRSHWLQRERLLHNILVPPTAGGEKLSAGRWLDTADGCQRGPAELVKIWVLAVSVSGLRERAGPAEASKMAFAGGSDWVLL